MKRALLFVLVAGALGIGAAEYLTISFPFRQWIGNVVRRGDLQALVGRRGIYANDVERAWRADLFAVGADTSEIEPAILGELKKAALQRLIEQERLHRAAAGAAVASSAVERETQLLRDQFRDEKTWQKVARRRGPDRARARA